MSTAFVTAVIGFVALAVLFVWLYSERGGFGP